MPNEKGIKDIAISPAENGWIIKKSNGWVLCKDEEEVIVALRKYFSGLRAKKATVPAVK